jgi:DNA-directed RNA polymerase specialized sigma24 family protein
VAAQGPSPAEVRQALEKLCRAYWRPIYAFIRSRGYDSESAADRTQSFLAQMIEKQYLREVSQDKGRLRSFLLVAVKHFLANAQERSAAAKRGGSAEHIPFEVRDGETWYEREPGHGDTPDRVYERAWATTILERSLSRLAKKHDAAEFERLRPFLTVDQDRGDYDRVAADLGVTLAALKVTIHRLRKAYRNAIRQEIAETVADEATVDDELRYLVSVLRRPS